MAAYRFIGSESDIGAIALRRFGQRVELTDDLAREAVLGGCAIISESSYSELFTAEDEKRYATAASRRKTPEEFQERFFASRIKLHEQYVAAETASIPEEHEHHA